MLWHSHLTQNVTSQDPLADGPTIQAAGTRALAAGCTLDKVCSLDADHHFQGGHMQADSPGDLGERRYVVTLSGLISP